MPSIHIFVSWQHRWELNLLKLLFSEGDSKPSILKDRVKINRWHWSLCVWQQCEQPFGGWNTSLIIFSSTCAMNTQPNRFQCSEPKTSWLIHRILQSSSCLLYLLHKAACVRTRARKANNFFLHFKVNLVRMAFSSFPRRNNIYIYFFIFINERLGLLSS